MAEEKKEDSTRNDLQVLENDEMESLISEYKQKVENLKRLELRLKWRTQRISSKSNLQTLFEYSDWFEQQAWISTLSNSAKICPELETEEDWVSDLLKKSNHQQRDTSTIIKRSESEQTLIVETEEEINGIQLDTVDAKSFEIEQEVVDDSREITESGQKKELLNVERLNCDLQIKINDMPPEMVEVPPSVAAWNFIKSIPSPQKTAVEAGTDFSLTWLLNAGKDIPEFMTKEPEESPVSGRGSTKFFTRNLSDIIQLEASLVSRCALQCMIRDKPGDLSPNDIRWHLNCINGAFLSIDFPCHFKLSELLFWRGLNVGTLNQQVLIPKVFTALLAFNFLQSDYVEFFDSGYRTKKSSGILSSFKHRL